MFAVELIGLPGSGKSTLSRELVRRLKAERSTSFYTLEDAFMYASKLHTDRIFRVLLNSTPDFISRLILRKIFNRTAYQAEKLTDHVLRNFASMKCLFEAGSFRRMSERDKRIVVAALLQSGALHEAVASLGQFNGVVLFDEGFVQASLSLGSPRDQDYDLNKVAEYLSLIPAPDLVVSLDAAIETCSARMQGRGKGVTMRLLGLGEEDLHAALAALRQVFRHVLSVLTDRGVRIVHVNCEGDIKTAVAAAVAEITPVVGDFCRRIKLRDHSCV